MKRYSNHIAVQETDIEKCKIFLLAVDRAREYTANLTKCFIRAVATISVMRIESLCTTSIENIFLKPKEILTK